MAKLAGVGEALGDGVCVVPGDGLGLGDGDGLGVGSGTPAVAGGLGGPAACAGVPA